MHNHHITAAQSLVDSPLLTRVQPRECHRLQFTKTRSDKAAQHITQFSQPRTFSRSHIIQRLAHRRKRRFIESEIHPKTGNAVYFFKRRRRRQDNSHVAAIAETHHCREIPINYLSVKSLIKESDLTPILKRTVDIVCHLVSCYFNDKAIERIVITAPKPHRKPALATRNTAHHTLLARQAFKFRLLIFILHTQQIALSLEMMFYTSFIVHNASQKYSRIRKMV